MDRMTREFLAMLLERQNELSERQIRAMKEAVMMRDELTQSLRAVGEGLHLALEIEDPIERRRRLDLLWKKIHRVEQHNQLRRLIAKLETAHDTLSANVGSLLSSLRNGPDDQHKDSGK